MNPTLSVAHNPPAVQCPVPTGPAPAAMSAPAARRRSRAALAGALLAVLAIGGASRARADGTPSVTVGAGTQAGFYACTTACIYSPGVVGANDNTVDGFALDSIRLYVNGSITDQIKMTFDTEYTGSGSAPGDNKVGVLDGIARFELNDQVNFWVGRFLPPSDRANLYGPYFANDWAPYADGVADYYPDVFDGRDNGAAYWGQFGLVKVQIGAFDGESLNSAVRDKSSVLGAARVMVDFWDPEPGYYLNGTYYGDKNILAIGFAGQTQDGRTDGDIDGLMERRFGTAGTLSVEAEYDRDNRLTAVDSSDGWYLLVSYLLPQQLGIGRIQPLVKYSDKTDDDYFDGSSNHVKTTEADLNYIIKEFNARVGVYYLHQSGVPSPTGSPYPTLPPPTVSPNEWGLKVQLQM
jgi:hypothetical protein